MNCPRCGKAIPLGASFCMHCGQPLVAAGPSPVHVTQGKGAIPIADAFDSQRRRTRTAAIFASLIALATVIAFGLQASGFLHIFGNDRSNALARKGATASPSLQKLGSVSPPPLEKMATRIEMPKDVKDWLEHLHQTEIARVNLTNGQIGDARVEQAKDNITGGLSGVESALNGIDDPSSELKSPVDNLSKMIKQMHDQCADLQKKFDDYPAPPECVPIQSAYDQALGETTSMLGDLGDHLAAGDVKKLQSMEGASPAGIDSAGAKSDRLVGEICDKYETKKWFSINKDIGPNGVLASPGP